MTEVNVSATLGMSATVEEMFVTVEEMYAKLHTFPPLSQTVLLKISATVEKLNNYVLEMLRVEIYIHKSS